MPVFGQGSDTSNMYVCKRSYLKIKNKKNKIKISASYNFLFLLMERCDGEISRSDMLDQQSVVLDRKGPCALNKHMMTMKCCAVTYYI